MNFLRKITSWLPKMKKNKKKEMASPILTLALVSLIAALLLSFFVKGDYANGLAYQKNGDRQTSVGSPYESSSSTSRYVLTEAIVSGSYNLTEDQARFASPDVSRYNNRFLSIFMPGVSFLGVPFYIIGQQFNAPQLLTYLSVTLFGFANMLLIARIAYKLGANVYASMLGGFLFLFGTNALAYSVVFTQHITSVSFILLSLLMLLSKPRVINFALFGVFLGMALLLDVPNMILMVPLCIALLAKNVTLFKQYSVTKLKLNLKIFAVLIGLIPMIVFTGWYNYQVTGTYTKIGQFIGQTAYFRDNVTVEKKNSETKAKVVPFNPRDQINGAYILLLSNERSWLVYSPIVLIGILGLYTLYRQRLHRLIANAIIGTVLLNVVLYSMFPDPWGGWAFGSRYLIPAAALMSIGVAIAIQQYKTKLWFGALFIVLAMYSLFISALGALTTSAVPPKVEAVNLASPIPYTYAYNLQFIQQNDLSSLLYNILFSQVSAIVYMGALVAIAGVVTILLYQSAVFAGRRRA